MLAMEISGRVGLWYYVGTLVGESKFNVPEFKVSISSAKLAAHGVGCPNENQSSWALNLRELLCLEFGGIFFIDGMYPLAQLLSGGIYMFIILIIPASA